MKTLLLLTLSLVAMAGKAQVTQATIDSLCKVFDKRYLPIPYNAVIVKEADKIKASIKAVDDKVGVVDKRMDNSFVTKAEAKALVDSVKAELTDKRYFLGFETTPLTTKDLERVTSKEVEQDPKKYNFVFNLDTQKSYRWNGAKYVDLILQYK